MKSTVAADPTRLRALLHDATTAPAETARRLAAERQALLGPGDDAYELLAVEQRWLASWHASAGGELTAELLSLRHDWLSLRVRYLCAAAPEPAVLLDLAEAEAAAAEAGEHELQRECAAAIDRGVEAATAGERLDREVAERFAMLTSAIDELSIAQQVAVLRHTSRVVRRLGVATRSRTCRRLGARLARAADDRELARRLERRLGRRGVTALETTNFVLLLVVLVTLLVEATVTLTPAQDHVLQWIDALACVFFIADFTFELALHPARWSWFVRNALTDLLPAIPSVLFLLPDVEVAGAADNLLLLRLLRLLRVTWAARYVQALRPLLRSMRLLLFLVRGLDGLAARFAQILNREFVMVPAAVEERRSAEQDDRRELLFGAQQREHELIALLPHAERGVLLRERIVAARAAMAGLLPSAFAPEPTAASGRDIAIGDAIEFLWSLRPQDIGRWLKPTDVQALDRVVRVLSAVPVRWLPIIRRLAVHPLPPDPEQRIVALGRRVAEWVEGWHSRMLFFADLHGIVTGPQILDRLAGAMVKATQRPATRLLLFGGLFLLFDLLLPGSCLSNALGKIVGLPLVLLGSFGLVVLTFGHWLKRVAGQASEFYRLTSEAHFISQLERVKVEYEREDIDFLARRVFRDGRSVHHARQLLAEQLDSVRTGVPIVDGDVPHATCLACNRVALLYLHFLDGAPLHISDVKTTEQLLANQSLENLRQEFLRIDAKEKKRLRKLKLDDGTLFSGPYLWFRFITESVAVEAAKRIAGYNRYCVPLAEHAAASPEALQQMEGWLERRLDPRGGRSAKEHEEVAQRGSYPTTEFTALDFLGGDPERDRYLGAMFGQRVLDVVRFDRRTMVREIFGTRPINHLPKHERSFNPLRFYERRLSRGRVLLAPLLLAWRFVRMVGWMLKKVRQIVREVVDPEVAMRRREIGEAPFAVALRKIHRMKAPGLIEAVRLRLQVDPVYAGAPPGWSADEPFADAPEIDADLKFLHLREREASRLREAAAAVRQQVGALHAALAWLPPLCEPEARCAAGELAVTCAWIADKDDVRTLLEAERWRAEVLPDLLATAERPGWWQALGRWCARPFGAHPAERWLAVHGRSLPRTAAPVLRAAYARDLRDTRRVVDAWCALSAEASPTATSVERLRQVYRHGAAVERDLLALRAVQSLAVLDVRNYRDLVFRIGEYGADGEDPAVAHSLP